MALAGQEYGNRTMQGGKSRWLCVPSTRNHGKGELLGTHGWRDSAELCDYVDT